MRVTEDTKKDKRNYEKLALGILEEVAARYRRMNPSQISEELSDKILTLPQDRYQAVLDAADQARSDRFSCSILGIVYGDTTMDGLVLTMLYCNELIEAGRAKRAAEGKYRLAQPPT